MSDILVGVDIGTSKVTAIIAMVNKDANNKIEVLGKGIDFNSGVNKGTIVDIESTSNAIMTAIRQAENMSDLTVDSAYVNIMGTQVNIIPKRIVVELGSKREITKEDILELKKQAENIEIPVEYQSADMVVKEFIIDGCEGINDPIGMVGSILECEADIIIGKTTTIQNIYKCFEKAEVSVEGLILEPYSLGEVALSSEEKDMGVILIDVGGTMTNVTVFEAGELIFYGNIPAGGNHITNDITIGLKVSNYEAERLKREYELALTSLIKNDQEITIGDLNEPNKRVIKVSEVVEIIEARLHEILALSKEMIDQNGILNDYRGGIVLTGSGISYVDGCVELASDVFEMPARIATFKASEPLKPEYASALGIIKFASKYKKLGNNNVDFERKEKNKKVGIVSKVKSFFESVFEV